MIRLYPLWAFTSMGTRHGENCIPDKAADGAMERSPQTWAQNPAWVVPVPGQCGPHSCALWYLGWYRPQLGFTLFQDAVWTRSHRLAEWICRAFLDVSAAAPDPHLPQKERQSLQTE